ncbi:solute carrier family 22 member 6-B isoform X2 [Salvelinus fontinalis]|uniref:solute carrier family 22 member 6-B isoform X2 n=1 Tax=Salvelinus fontinalis TaxID=8038 RepID=UPI0024863346|nr:solute carrier family 22 member 6-B isoform X2 [Salvelinus fontinalis]
MNFDQILTAVGGFGKYQKILYVWICLPQILLGFHMMASIFTGATPGHRCRDSPSSGPGNNVHNGSLALTSSVTVTAKLNLSIPVEPQVDDSCVLMDILTENGTARAPCEHGGTWCVTRHGSTVWGLLSTCWVCWWEQSSLELWQTGTEWTCAQRRMLAGVFTDYFFGLGYMLIAGLAYLIRDWRKLQLAMSVPGFLFIFYIWVLPQSARWLLANDRREEAIVLLRKAATVNGRVLPPTIQVDRCDLEGRRRHSAADLIRTPQMRKRALILFYVWFVNVLVYYGLSLGVSKLGSDLYLTQFIFGLVEIPARSLVLLFLPWSRRLSQSGFLALGGVACLLTLTVPTDHPNLITGLAMVGKFGITASFAVIYVYTAEIFPTVLRQTGIGVSSMFARVGGVLAPLINMLHTRSPSLPMLIFGCAPLLGAVLALALPETANRPLPDTLEDAENWDTRFPPKKGQGEDIIQSASSTEGQELQRLATES